MIYLTQIIYINTNEEAAFHQFENVAIPLISKYNGRLLLRLRPTDTNVIESNIETPYEIHIVEFASQKDFDSFKIDKKKTRFYT
ncbi:hypothetical protein ACFSKN_09840 [Mariniflexile gromovii]|uniref:DUF1330 domain-containing protein n=1 Tax=Mariniflexile gromovii TaxID=362523 RepID=A0ABS4BWR4_9FLAO|nr:hypothetical protein [Mariniflexile gromovii]MBP0905030.1 hypothetical protein [Mariniflexile gromovii]